VKNDLARQGDSADAEPNAEIVKQRYNGADDKSAADGAKQYRALHADSHVSVEKVGHAIPLFHDPRNV
jgi:hypothetical protein